MKRICFFLTLLALVAFSQAHAVEGLIAVKSPHGAKVTMDAFESMANERGLHTFARIDHAAGAAQVGTPLRPTEVLIFGNPQGGTPLMECAQTIGIDLPLKVLVWEDASSQVWLGYNDPGYLAQRHGVPDCPAAKSLQKALAGLAAAATSP